MDTDLINELQSLNKTLSLSIKKLAENGSKLAEAERDYKIKLHDEVLRLKSEGTPATLISLIIYGIKEVADLRFARDVAEVSYNTNLEYINATKLQMRIIENQIDREWGNG